MYAAGQSLLGETARGHCNHLDLQGGFSGNLSFHAVAFGPSSAILQRMVNLATDTQNRAPPNPMRPPIPSTYTTVLDSVRTVAGILVGLD
jgi:hypothetical protein